MNIFDIDMFPFFLNGKIKNAKINAKPRCKALAGNPLITPTSNINGNGEAYQS